MYIFSSIQATIQAGFRWSAYLSEEHMHLVEIDRVDRRGRKLRALALARDADPTSSP
jgi:hypothetical protein